MVERSTRRSVELIVAGVAVLASGCWTEVSYESPESPPQAASASQEDGARDDLFSDTDQVVTAPRVVDQESDAAGSEVAQIDQAESLPPSEDESSDDEALPASKQSRDIFANLEAIEKARQTGPRREQETPGEAAPVDEAEESAEEVIDEPLDVRKPIVEETAEEPLPKSEVEDNDSFEFLDDISDPFRSDSDMPLSEVGELSETRESPAQTPGDDIEPTTNNSPEEASPVNSKRAAWSLGASLATAVATSQQDKVPLEDTPQVDAARRAAEELGLLNLDTQAADSADPESNRLSGLLSPGRLVGRQLHATHDPVHVALFELAYKTTLLPILYGPGSLRGDAIGNVLRSTAERAQLPQPLWQPLLSVLAEEPTTAQLDEAIASFSSRVVEFLADESSDELAP